jgi:hypothetical protein
MATLAMGLSYRNSSYTVNVRSVYDTGTIRCVLLRQIIRSNTGRFRSVFNRIIAVKCPF